MPFSNNLSHVARPLYPQTQIYLPLTCVIFSLKLPLQLSSHLGQSRPFLGKDRLTAPAIQETSLRSQDTLQKPRRTHDA